jgi:hypothetical protein
LAGDIVAAGSGVIIYVYINRLGTTSSISN